MKLDFFIASFADFVNNDKNAFESAVYLSNSIFPCRDARVAFKRNNLKPKYVAFVVDTNNRKIPVGFIIWRLTDVNNALLYRIGVKKNYRRHGIGTAMFMFSTRYLPCHRKGCMIMLHCSINNKIAMRFYERIGFTRSKEIKKYYSNGDSAFEYTFKT